jgi:ABC-2 type transport system ATP-binding protein
MDDIEALCSRIMLINYGKIVSDGTLDDLRSRVTNDRWLVIDLADEQQSVSDDDAKVLKREGGRVTLCFDPRTVSTASLIARLTARHSIRDLFVHNPPIEQIIAQLFTEVRA